MDRYNSFLSNTKKSRLICQESELAESHTFTCISLVFLWISLGFFVILRETKLQIYSRKGRGVVGTYIETMYVDNRAS